MVLFKRKPVQLLTRPPGPPIHEDQEVWSIEDTDEVFTTYEDYLQRMDFLKQKKFICPITGHSGLSFFDAKQSEMNASGEVEDAFPDALREPILRKVQFSTISRIDNLVDHIFEIFRRDFYPGENVTVILDGGERLNGLVREKTKFPEIIRADGTKDREAFVRYFVSLKSRPGEEALVDEEHITRDRKTFTKQRLRSFIKNTVDREAWTGAPWIVRTEIANQYRINTEVPAHLEYDNQVALRKANHSHKKGEYDGMLMNFSASQRLPELKPKSHKSKNAQDPGRTRQEQVFEFQYALTGNPAFGKVPPPNHPQFSQFINNHPGFGGFPQLPGKNQFKPLPTPQIKYPIEDLEIPPLRDGANRPALKFLCQDPPSLEATSELPSDGILMKSVGPLLETWNTLNVYCEVFQLDSFTFDDYIDALQFSSENVQCQLLVEIHCAVLKKLVNDVNDKNGQVQVSLPELAQHEDEENDSMRDSSTAHTPTPEPNVKPSGRTTRSSLAKSGASEIKDSVDDARSSTADSKHHRGAEVDQSTRMYDWKMRLRKRDFHEGRWVVIVVGLLNQLSGNNRLRKVCDEILVQLAPLDREPTPETAISQYANININLRISIIQILCMLSLETKAIRGYMEDCNNQMTEYRKEKIDLQRARKTAVEEMRVLHEDRKALQPNTNPPSPLAELEELEDGRVEGLDEEGGDEDEIMDSDDEEPIRGRSLRRANDRALERKRKQDEEKERKERVQAEKAKKPTKQAKQLERLTKKIDDTKDRVKELEEEVVTIENDLREADCPRTRVLGKDRFWNRYYWMERNAMPYAGLPDSSTADAGYANGCIWVQGPYDLERQGFIELSESENAQYRRAFQMSVPERKLLEEGSTHVFSACQWGYYDDPDHLDMLIGWLDVRGTRESKLRKELQAQRDKISMYMQKRKEYLAANKDKKSESCEPTSRISTRTKTYIDPSGHRCLAWRNGTALRELGHLHSEPRLLQKKQTQTVKATKKAIEEEGRQTRATNRNGKGISRQGTRYSF